MPLGGVPKNPRRLSEFEANLSRRERRKSKAWSGVEEGEEEDGRRKSSVLLDAEELKGLLFGQLRRVSLVFPFNVLMGLAVRLLWGMDC